ncbi:MAG: hypothetical protein NEA02_08595 [Thermoanaerobaculia bacterium]|nr:hypothetical protein [Thermoanaerobaculia bacterium]
MTAILVLAVALRRWGWENWSLWLDECLQVFVARQPTRQILERLQYERTHPPLDYFLTHLALKVSASALFLRWIPTLLSAATACLVFARAGAARRPLASLGAAFCFAVLPFAVHQGQELRPYALALFWVAVADASRAWHDAGGRRLALAGTAAASVLAVYSLLLAFLPLAAFWILDVLDARDARSKGESGGPAFARLRLIPALTILAFLPWIYFVRTNMSRAHEMPAPRLSASLALRHVVGFLADRQAGTDRVAAACVLLAIAGAGAALASRVERRRIAVEGAATIGGAAAFLLVTNHWFELRYFWFALWPLSRCLGEGLGAAARLPRWRVPAFAAALAIVLAVEAPALAENAATGRPDWRRVPGYVASRRTGAEPILVPVDWWSFMLLDYQQLVGDPPFRLEQPSLTVADLDAALARAGEGWVVRAPNGDSETAGRLRVSSLPPGATFHEADGAVAYRFEKGRLVAP